MHVAYRVFTVFSEPLSELANSNVDGTKVIKIYLLNPEQNEIGQS